MINQPTLQTFNAALLAIMANVPAMCQAQFIVVERQGVLFQPIQKGLLVTWPRPIEILGLSQWLNDVFAYCQSNGYVWCRCHLDVTEGTITKVNHLVGNTPRYIFVTEELPIAT